MSTFRLFGCCDYFLLSAEALSSRTSSGLQCTESDLQGIANHAQTPCRAIPQLIFASFATISMHELMSTHHFQKAVQLKTLRL